MLIKFLILLIVKLICRLLAVADDVGKNVSFYQLGTENSGISLNCYLEQNLSGFVDSKKNTNHIQLFTPVFAVFR